MTTFLRAILPSEPSINFIGRKQIAFALSVLTILASFALLATKGLNFGIDFTGGILIEARMEKPADLSSMRKVLKDLNLGDVSLQHLGNPNDVMIRIGQKSENTENYEIVVEKIKDTLAANIASEIKYRKVDFVGPKVGGELIKSGAMALIFSFIAIMIYIWFRFEWHYGLGAILALIHDVLLTLGFFSATQLEFNLSSIAAILTIIGYSINDSVVIYDRIRENLRRFKKMAIEDLINKSLNETLSRTILTAGTTILALLALALLGGPVVKSFSLAALFGVIIGTYSSIYVAAPVLLHMKLGRNN